MVIRMNYTMIDMEENGALSRLPFSLLSPSLQINVSVDKSINGLSLERNGEQVNIRCSKPVYAYRALGLLCQNADNEAYAVTERAAFDTNGLMIDCSRNAVPKPEVLRSLLDQMALMGLDTLLLYMEDTYKISDEPYFGYMRGGYTAQELKGIVAYAEQYGIEVVPCIQTLAHLNTMLRLPNYASMKDIQDVLLVNDDRTYDLIEKMIRTCREVFNTKRIHIGMDEAPCVGRGRYMDQHGHEDSYLLMCEHLDKVNKLCIKYDFEPMIWSDLLFKWANDGNYYGENPISDEILSRIPDNVQLTYWDYYNNAEKVYDRMLKMHLEACKRTVFAGGAWKWNGYFPYIRASLYRTQQGLAACQKNGVRDVFTTAWGDDGSDAALLTILPMVQQQAELNFYSEISDETLKERLKICTGADLEQFLLMDMSTVTDDGFASSNFHKYMLFQDVLLGLFDRHVPSEIIDRYQTMYTALSQADKTSVYGYMLETLETLTAILAKKADLGIQIKAAYDAGNVDFLRKTETDLLPELISLVELFHVRLEKQWMQENKPIGFEGQDARIGALLQRLKSARSRLRLYLDGAITHMEELEVERLPYVPENDGKTIGLNVWYEMITASVF